MRRSHLPTLLAMGYFALAVIVASTSTARPGDPPPDVPEMFASREASAVLSGGPAIAATSSEVRSLTGENSSTTAGGPERQRMEMTPIIQGSSAPTRPDPLAAGGLNQLSTPPPSITFEGLDSEGYTPPDPNGAVGPDHYVQMVNVSFAVFDKQGTMLTPRIPFNQLFAGSGLSYCESYNDGYPRALYDREADRWLLSQWVLPGGNSYMCFAVSQTPDPMGAYWLYQFALPEIADYPMIGIWSDGYFIGANTGFPNAYYAFAFDRANMLAGNPASFQYSGGHPNFLMPADIDGAVLPPAGRAATYYTFLSDGYPDHPPGPDRLAIYEFDVDWATPANSTFALTQEIPIAPFNYTVCGFFVSNCIPQPGTSQKLDSLSYWPMWRFAYRNFGSHESMVGNFTVDVDGTDRAAIRWFELRNDLSGWALHQEGTYAPDADHRWMASIAMDGLGNIALGYSTSSSTTLHEIRYTTRQPGDPPGTLRAEQTMYSSGGVHTGISRWGDYTSMTVDPTDDCTFWYTNQYDVSNNSGFDWHTRVGAFRFAECGVPDFYLNATPLTSSICSGSDAVYDVYVLAVAGFTNPVSLSASGHPTGTTAGFAPNPVTPPGASVLTIGNTASAAAGNYVVTVSGTASGSGGHTLELGLAVYDGPPGAPSPTLPPDGAVDQPLRPTFAWNAGAQSRSYSLEVDEDPSFASPQLVETGIADTSFTPGQDLPSNTTFYWRVTAENDCGEGLPSEVFSLRTLALPGDCPDGTVTVIHLSEDFESGAPGWSHGGTGDTWTLSGTRVHDGMFSYHATNVADVSDQMLQSPDIALPSDTPLTLQFWNWQEMESSTGGCYDGGILEISTDGGSSWTQVPNAALITDPYDGEIPVQYGNPLGGLEAWCGDPQDWLRSFADLTAYAGVTARFRFRIGTDNVVEREGWYVDDVVVQSCAPDSPILFVDGFESGDTSAWSATVP